MATTSRMAAGCCQLYGRGRAFAQSILSEPNDCPQPQPEHAPDIRCEDGRELQACSRLVWQKPVTATASTICAVLVPRPAGCLSRWLNNGIGCVIPAGASAYSIPARDRPKSDHTLHFEGLGGISEAGDVGFLRFGDFLVLPSEISKRQDGAVA